jgi:hypothetical protein
MIKKTFFLLLTLTGLLISCQKDSDVQGDIDDIKARLEAIEKGKSIATITFQSTNMILTYNTGETVTLPMPEGLKGDKGDPGTNGTNGTNGKDGVNGTNGKDGVNGTNGTNGADGKDGVGITSINYDSTTGILTIKLSNGNESNFQIVSSADGILSAVLLADTKGKMLVKSVYAGIVPYAEVTYDTGFNITNVTSSIPTNGIIVKSSEVTKKYSNNKLVGVNVKKYASNKQAKFNTIFINNSSFDTTTQTNKGNYFTIPLGDGLYYVYVFVYQSGVNSWEYQRFTAIKSSTRLIDRYWKYNENVVYLVSSYKLNIGYTNDMWYEASEKYVKTGFANIGELISEDNYDIETLENGLVNKVTDPVKNRSIQFTYNSTNHVTKAVEYINGVEARNMTYEYNTMNWLTSIKETEGGNTKEVVKTLYDEKGNPIEIYSYLGAVYTDSYSMFDPWSNPGNPWAGGSLIRDAGLYLFAKIEYDKYKNFFGNTIGSIFPGLSGYNFVNAPKRIAFANGGFGSIEYKDFNELGYPRVMAANAIGGNDEGAASVHVELLMNYVKRN